MSKHTPGPWYATFDDYRWVIDCQGEFGPKKALAVTAGFYPKHEANARLIAAAPELLEAAQMVIAWYKAEDDHSKADFYERMQMCRDSESALRAAIAKATGEQA